MSVVSTAPLDSSNALLPNKAPPTTEIVSDRIQNALKAQLLQTRDRILQELREKQDNLKRIKKEREDVGVELYGMQQQLSLLQDTFDEAEAEHETQVKHRMKMDANLSKLKEKEIEFQQEKEGSLKKVSKNKEALEEALSALRQAKQFNLETKDEVAASKRAASKADEIVKGAEKKKEIQDRYIDKLHQQIHSVEEEIELVDTELVLVKKKSKDSDSFIQDMTSELEALISEKKYLVQQWNSTVLALGRRDQALVAVREALNKAEATTRDNRVEMIGMKRELAELEAEKEKSDFDYNRINSEIQYIEKEVLKIQSEKESVASEIELTTNIITVTQGECKVQERELKRHKSTLKSLMHKIEIASSERHEVEEDIQKYKEEQAAFSQGASNVVKEEAKLSKGILEKETDINETEKEMGRIKIDIMNTTIHCSQLKDRLHDEVEKSNSKTNSIATLEKGIKRMHNDIESKMNKVDRLNRKYQEMVDSVEEDEPLGPLEATIKSLERDIAAVESASKELKDDWISKQGKLIQAIQKTEALDESLRKKSATLVILKQKRLRILKAINMNEAALQDLEAKSTTMHTDMSRLNDLIGKYKDKKSTLKRENDVKQIECEEEMKELRQEIIETEAKIVESQEAKEKLLSKIMITEKEVLLWEKKIQLEKETQAALNTSDHAMEIKGMSREIRRMKYRLDEMKRYQEKLVREMELAIHKREDIALKFRNKKGRSKGGGVDEIETIAELKKRRQELTSRIEDATKVDSEIKSKEQELETLAIESSKELQIIQKDVENETKEAKALHDKINKYLFQKQRYLLKTTRMKDLKVLYENLTAEEALDDKKDSFNVHKNTTIMESKHKRLLNALEGLRLKHSTLDNVFERVQILARDLSFVLEPLDAITV